MSSNAANNGPSSAAPRGDDSARPAGSASFEFHPPARVTSPTPARQESGILSPPPGFETPAFVPPAAELGPIVEHIRRVTSSNVAAPPVSVPPSPSPVLGGEQGGAGPSAIPQSRTDLGGEQRANRTLPQPMTSVMDRYARIHPDDVARERIRLIRGKQVQGATAGPSRQPQPGQPNANNGEQPLTPEEPLGLPDREFQLSPPVMVAYERFRTTFNASPLYSLPDHTPLTPQNARAWGAQLTSAASDFRVVWETARGTEHDHAMMMAVANAAGKQIAYLRDRQQRDGARRQAALLPMSGARTLCSPGQVPRSSAPTSAGVSLPSRPAQLPTTRLERMPRTHVRHIPTPSRSPPPASNPAVPPATTLAGAALCSPGQEPRLPVPTSQPEQALSGAERQIVGDAHTREVSDESQSHTIGSVSEASRYLPNEPQKLYQYNGSYQGCPLYLQILPMNRVRVVMKALQTESRKLRTRPSTVERETRSPLVNWVTSKLNITHDVGRARSVAIEIAKQTTPQSTDASHMHTYMNIWQNMPVGTYAPQLHQLVQACAMLFRDTESLKFVALVMTFMLQESYWVAGRVSYAREELRQQLASLIQALTQHELFVSGRFVVAVMTGSALPRVDEPVTPALPTAADTSMLDVGIPTTRAAILSPPPTIVNVPPPVRADRRGLGARALAQVSSPGERTPFAPQFVSGGIIGGMPAAPALGRERGITIPPPPHVIGYVPTTQQTLSTRSRSLEPSNWMTAAERTQLFQPGTLGVYTANTIAPKQWPDFAYHFGYQQQPYPMQNEDGELVSAPPLPMESYAKLPNLVTHGSAKPMRWKPEELLTTSMRFTDWYNDVLNDKLLQMPGTARHPDQLFMRIISGMSTDLQGLVATYVRKARADVHLHRVMLWEPLSVRNGAVEWLQFVLRAVCNRDTDKELEQASLITHNIRAESDGSTLEFCVHKLIWAVSVLSSRDMEPNYRMLVNRMIRIFAPIRAHDFDRLIQVRHIGQVAADGTSEVSTFEYTNNTMDQGDMLPTTNAPDWKRRWHSICKHAKQLSERARTLIPQRLPEENLFPTYITATVDIHDPEGVAHPSGYPRPASKGLRSSSAYRSRSPSRDRYGSRAFSNERGRSRYYDDRGRSRSMSRERASYRPSLRSREPSRERVAFATPHPASNTAKRPPPSFRDQISWYQNRKCLACGAQPTEHPSWKSCPVRAQHFPSWTPDLSSLASQAPSQALAACETQQEPTIDLSNEGNQHDLHVAAAQPKPGPFSPEQAARQQTNLGSKYAHRDTSGRSEFQRDRSRSRDRNFNSGRSQQHRGTSQDRGRSRDRSGPWQRDARRDHSRSRDRGRSFSRERPQPSGENGGDRRDGGQRDRSRGNSQEPGRTQAPYHHQPSNANASA